MKEKLCDMWEEIADAKCITTNGYIKKNGAGVMGAGIAGEMQSKFPGIEIKLGKNLKDNGNHVQILHVEDIRFNDEVDDNVFYVQFPVKNYFFEDANLRLIARSCKELVELTDLYLWDSVLLPRPGCGNGHRSWTAEVKPICSHFFDDRFTIIAKL